VGFERFVSPVDHTPECRRGGTADDVDCGHRLRIDLAISSFTASTFLHPHIAWERVSRQALPSSLPALGRAGNDGVAARNRLAGIVTLAVADVDDKTDRVAVDVKSRS
jgi:hypothetical protein